MIKIEFDIVLVRSNPIFYDPRVTKIALSLSQKYRVLILGWDRKGIYAFNRRRFTKNVECKFLKLKGPVGTITLLPYMLIYQAWVLINLIIYNPDIVHACDLDGAIPGYIFKVISRKKLIFDVFDRYAWGFPGIIVRKLYKLIKLLEDLLAAKSDALIVVSKPQFVTFRYFPRMWAIIPNYPLDVKIMRTKKSSGSKRNKFKIVFAGTICKGRGLLEICKAIKDFRDVEFMLCGEVADTALFKNLMSFSFVKYLGILPYEEALKLEATADLIPVLIDPQLPTFITVNPNKLFEAMMLAVPVISNIEWLVTKNKCGLFVPYGEINRIRNAILHLKTHKSICRQMGYNGRRAFERYFNWFISEKKLFQIYVQLME